MRILASIILASTILVSCSSNENSSTNNQTAVKEVKKEIDPMQDLGIGPIKHLELSETINQSLSDEGKLIYEAKCTACHKLDKRKIGPPMIGVTKKRSPEWIMNMILNPDEMVKENEQARQLLMEYSAPMANQSLSENEARAILEYFRALDA